MKRIKKLAAIGLAALLLVSTMSSMAVFAADDAPASLFSGGDVEKATLKDDGSVEDFGGQWDPVFSGATLETKEVHGGTKAIKLTSNLTDGTKHGASVHGGWLKSSTVDSYSEVRCWVKAENLDTDIGSYVRIKLIKNKHSSTAAADHIIECKIKEDTDWQMLSFPYVYSETCFIQFRVFGTGVAYVDDVTVVDTTNCLLPSTFYNYNWIDKIPSQSSKLDMATTANFRLDTTESIEGAASLYLEATDSYKTPVIYHQFGGRNKPVSGENYRISFRFKPAEDGGKPLAYIATTAVSSKKTYITNQLATFNPGYTLIEGDKRDGWQEYHAYFTMPEVSETTNVVFCLRGGVGNNGWYDSFSLVRDYEEDVKVVNDAGEAVKTAAVGDKVSLQAHVISEIAEADGGENVMLLVAAYNEEGTLQCVDVACKTETIYAGKEYTAEEVGTSVGNAAQDVTYKFITAAKDITFDYTVPESAAGCTLKAFCWNGGSLKPMGSAYKVTVAAK